MTGGFTLKSGLLVGDSWQPPQGWQLKPAGQPHRWQLSLSIRVGAQYFGCCRAQAPALVPSGQRG